MTDLFAPRPASRPSFSVSKAQLRGVIWLLALAVFVLLPKPFADTEPAAAQTVAHSSESPSAVIPARGNNAGGG